MSGVCVVGVARSNGEAYKSSALPPIAADEAPIVEGDVQPQRAQTAHKKDQVDL